MTNPSKKRGTQFESDVVAFLRRVGFPHAERRALGGIHDRGDILGIPGWVLEAKATREIDLAGALTEAAAEARNAGARYYAAIVKRRRKPTHEAYAVLPLWALAELLADDPDRDRDDHPDPSTTHAWDDRPEQIVQATGDRL